MAARVLADGLDRYRVGARVRRLRLRKKISLKDLASHTGLSAALLSKLERERVMPTLPTLMRIAVVFGVGLEAFFVNDAPGAVVTRASERLRFPEQPGDGSPAFDFECLNFAATGRRLNAYLATFRRGAPPRAHAHDEAELLYVLAGVLLVQVEDDDHELAPGDAIYIHAAVAHAYTARSHPCSALVVTVGVSDPAASAPPRDGTRTLPAR